MKINNQQAIKELKILSQKYYPEYGSPPYKIFKTEEAFKLWLKEKAVMKIHFKDNGQDCLIWWIDRGGEVLHSELQSSVWDGKIVDLSRLKVNENIGVLDTEKMKTLCLDFIVKEIEEL